MKRAAAELAEEIRSLDPVELGKLLRMLLNDLDGQAVGVARTWLDEAQRRSREVDASLVTTIPANEVFACAQAVNAVNIGAKVEIVPNSSEILAMAAASFTDVPSSDLCSLAQRLLEQKV